MFVCETEKDEAKVSVPFSVIKKNSNTPHVLVIMSRYCVPV